MADTAIERRRLAVAVEGTTVDIASPVGTSVGDVLARAGIPVDPARHALLTRSGREVDPSSAVDDLHDGTLLALVDLTVHATPRRRGDRAGATRQDYAALWWTLSSVGALLTVWAFLCLAGGDPLLHDAARPLVAGALGAVTLASAAFWALRHRPGGGAALPLTALIALSSATAVLAVTPLHEGTHLAVAAAFGAQAILFGLMGAAAPAREVRGMVGTAGTFALILTGIWGGTLLLTWPMAAAAGITMGLAAPGMRLIPTLLLDVHEGYSINYQHFMSQRWTVRGTVPDDPGEVTMDVVGPHVGESTARLTVGVSLLTVAAVVCSPIVAPALHSSHLLVRIGAVGVFAATISVLLLNPRHRSSTALRWTPRVGASLIAVVLAFDYATGASNASRMVLATAAMLIGFAAIALIVPVSKGASSLVWSRMGDFLEWMGVAFALPMALLAANVVELVRAMMSS